MSAQSRRLTALTIAALCLAPFALVGAASAANYDDDDAVVLDEKTPAPGQTITVEACCFKSLSFVDIVLHSTPRLLANVQANAEGRVSAQVTVPADMPVGAHTVVMSGVDANGATLSFQTAVTVAAQQTSGGGLPRTGAAIGSMVGAGLVLTLGGVMLTKVRRTRIAGS